MVAKEIPIVQEITSVLLEWGKLWKNLYIVSFYDFIANIGFLHNVVLI